MPGLRTWLKEQVLHLYHGFRLLAVNTRIALRLRRQMRRGQQLTRRERQLLEVTTNDLIRLVPFSVFVIVPAAEVSWTGATGPLTRANQRRLTEPQFSKEVCIDSRSRFNAAIWDQIRSGVFFSRAAPTSMIPRQLVGILSRCFSPSHSFCSPI